MMQTLTNDLSFAWRQVLKRPAASLLIIVTLALGIGAYTVMFSAAGQVLLAPLPYANDDRLLVIEQQIPGRGMEDAPWSYPTLADLRSQSTSLTSIAGYQQQSLSMLKSDGPVSV